MIRLIRNLKKIIFCYLVYIVASTKSKGAQLCRLKTMFLDFQCNSKILLSKVIKLDPDLDPNKTLDRQISGSIARSMIEPANQCTQQKNLRFIDLFIFSDVIMILIIYNLRSESQPGFAGHGPTRWVERIALGFKHSQPLIAYSARFHGWVTEFPIRLASQVRFNNIIFELWLNTRDFTRIVFK